MNEVSIKCACGAEIINFEQDEETGEVYVAIFRYGKDNMTIWNKIRWIVQIIKGTPYNDQIVIDKGWLPLLIDHLGAMWNKTETR